MISNYRKEAILPKNIQRRIMKVKIKILSSKRGQIGVGDLSGFAISLLVVGIVVVVAFFIMGSFQTILTKNGEDTPAVNASITDTNNSFSIIQNLPSVTIGITLSIILVILFFIFRRGRREEEVRD